MRVLMVNAFHWPKGGVERTLFDETRWLGTLGHEVNAFATRDSRNLPSPLERHFAPRADFGEDTPAWKQLPQLPRAIWSAPAAGALAGLLAEWRPDVAHVHAPSRDLTPSVLAELARARVPTVMTLHDFKPWCTNRVLFALGAPCQRCQGGKHWHAITTGCVQHSRLKSLVGAVEAYSHDRRHAYASVRRFLAPSHFVREKVVELGADPARVHVLVHGVEAPAAGPAPADLPPRFALFAGRLSEEKGVRLLPELAKRIVDAMPLLVAGGGPEEQRLLRMTRTSNLRLLGHLSPEALAAVRSRATMVLVPSLFPETFGYAVAEAQLEARVVVASRIGALPELVRHEATGLLVEPGKGASAWHDAIMRVLQDPAAEAWGRAAREQALREHAPAAHASALVAHYEAAIRG